MEKLEEKLREVPTLIKVDTPERQIDNYQNIQNMYTEKDIDGFPKPLYAETSSRSE